MVPQSQQAEVDLRGNMVKDEYAKDVDGATLWLLGGGAETYMTEDMARWFNQHGRYTYDQ